MVGRWHHRKNPNRMKHNAKPVRMKHNKRPYKPHKFNNVEFLALIIAAAVILYPYYKR